MHNILQTRIFFAVQRANSAVYPLSIERNFGFASGQQTNTDADTGAHLHTRYPPLQRTEDTIPREFEFSNYTNIKARSPRDGAPTSLPLQYSLRCSYRDPAQVAELVVLGGVSHRYHTHFHRTVFAEVVNVHHPAIRLVVGF